ncbi:LysR family transcriptional regulator [Limibacillus halophilus]
MPLKRRHLEVFDALMQAGSVSDAAARLNVTQPAVSVALSELEKLVGFRLFERTKGYFAPTRDAQLLFEEARQGLLAMSRIDRLAGDIRDGKLGSISIGSNGAAAINLLPRLIADYQHEKPGIRIDLEVRTSRQCAALVSSRQIDIGLIDAPAPVAGLDVEIFPLPCVCVMRKDDPLADLPVVGPKNLAGRPVVAITGDHRIDRELDGLLADADTAVERRVSCSYFAIARNLVRNGAGVALVDYINGCMDLGDGVVWRRFEPRINFELAMITAKELTPTPYVDELLARLRAIFRSEPGEGGAPL